ncbi:MAG TPA: tetratricopeptide repeat protein [Verrucomicrobiae bacterium]|nr:tetratricopeptide repeat protein [Verrucomicrobiae bacterium]
MNSTLAVQKDEMTTQFETPRVRGFVPSMWPWVLGAVMFGVFLVTLSPWVTPYNLGEVLDLANWNQNSEAFGPVTFIITAPLRWLSPGRIPLALNLFSAFCGALALVTLARSVALLPHDRTHEQREREDSEFSILTMWASWLPPLFAVLVCGLQLTFWQQATIGTTEMFNLLIFAYVIRCLLEYRISGEESWLTKFAVVYGLGMANNWAMVGFFPAFLAAMIWIKGLGAFSPRFIIRTFCLGLAGVSVIFLLPVLNKVFHGSPQTYWQMLRALLSADKKILTVFPKDVVRVLALTSLLPVFVMGIKWASYFGDNSPLGIFLATSMFHIVHALFLLTCLWVALDSPISPRQMGFGIPFLTFYYLGALAIGYLSGYFLLVFGVEKSRHPVHPIVRALKFSVVAGVFLLLIGGPALMLRKNLPHVEAIKKGTQFYENYINEVARLLPSKGAVVLSDDSFRLGYLQAALCRNEGHTPHLLVDTARLEQEPGYLRYLEKSNPGYQLSGPWTNIPPDAIPVLGKVRVLQHLAATHPIYYMHPSFGYYFEGFYAEPHGLIYQLKPYPEGTWDVPALSKTLIAENQLYWKKLYDEVLPPLIDYVAKPSLPPTSTPWKKTLDKLHLKPEVETLAFPAAVYYARVLDEWGVQLLTCGLRDEADKCFDEVVKLNPRAISARVNKNLDESLAAGKKLTIRPAKEIEKSLEQYSGGWTELLRTDGPIDDPSFRSELGLTFATGWNSRQAIQEFHRVRTLVPDDARISLQLAQLFIYVQDHTNGLSLLLPYSQGYSLALSNIDNVLKSYPNLPTALFMKSYTLMQMKSYEQAIDPLTHYLANTKETNDYRGHLNRAIAYYKMGNYDAAKSDYEVVGRIDPKVYQVYYGLGEIAYLQKDKDAAIKNYQLYLTNAPPDTEEAKNVNARLKELKTGP